MDNSIEPNEPQRANNSENENANAENRLLRRRSGEGSSIPSSKRVRTEKPINSSSYKNKIHSNQAFDAMNAMRKQKLLCDVTLQTDGGLIVEAHKIILAASSQYFHAMFGTFFEERHKCLIKLQGVDHQALELLIEYIYSSEISITEENVQTLLPAANILQLTDIHDACCDFLQSQLDPSNCLGFKNFAEIHGCFELVATADKYLKQHFSRVVKAGEFLALPVDKVIQIISCDDLEVISEAKVFEAVISWINMDIAARQDFLAQLMEHVRLPLLSSDYLVRCVQDHPLLKTNLQCQHLIIEAFRYLLLKNDIGEASLQTSRTKLRSQPKIIIAIGGRSREEINVSEYFSFEDETWHQMPELSTIRYSSGLTIYEKNIIITGGSNRVGSSPRVDVYDVSKNQWTTFPPMKSYRLNHGVAVIGNSIYVVGGNNMNNRLYSAEVYDSTKKEWREIAPMLATRSAVGVGVMDGLLYAVGGYGTALYLSSVERYNSVQKKWESVAQMSCQRSGVGVGVIDNILYAIGGCDQYSSLKSAEAYNPITNKWNPIADMEFCRKDAGVVTHNGLLYVVGGFDSQSKLNSVEVYSPKKNTWTTLPNSMSIGRSGFGIAIVEALKLPSIQM